jgi:chromosome segregation ATPase
VNLIEKDIKKVVKEQVAKEQERDELVARKKLLEKNLPGMRDRLMARAAVVESAEERAKNGEKDVTVQFAPEDRPVSLRDAKIKLEVWVTEVASAEKEAAHLDAKIASLNRIILKLDEQQAAMKKAKADLDGAIDELQEDVLALQIQQMESKYQTDDTRTARIKEAIEKQRKRIDLQKRELAKLQGTGDAAATKSVKEIMAPVTTPVKAEGAAGPAAMPKASE